MKKKTSRFIVSGFFLSLMMCCILNTISNAQTIKLSCGEYDDINRTLYITNFSRIANIPVAVKYSTNYINMNENNIDWNTLFTIFPHLISVSNGSNPPEEAIWNITHPTWSYYRTMNLVIVPDLNNLDDILENVKKYAIRVQIRGEVTDFTPICSNFPNCKRIYYYGTTLPTPTSGKNIFGETSSPWLIKFYAPNIGQILEGSFEYCNTLKLIGFSSLFDVEPNSFALPQTQKAAEEMANQNIDNFPGWNKITKNYSIANISLLSNLPTVLRKQAKSITITETSAPAPITAISNTEFPECKTIFVPDGKINYAINMLADGMTIKENVLSNPDFIKINGTTLTATYSALYDGNSVLAVNNASYITKLVVSGLQAGPDNRPNGPELPGFNASILAIYNNTNLEIEVLDDVIPYCCFCGISSIKKITVTNAQVIEDLAFVNCLGITELKFCYTGELTIGSGCFGNIGVFNLKFAATSFVFTNFAYFLYGMDTDGQVSLTLSSAFTSSVDMSARYWWQITPGARNEFKKITISDNICN